ncbi:hypothetical protein AB9P05_02105 [Roseivirga sp. BDSF3-8]|uniref:hypothetical protein n=1 Tax=Roseivirga sp. BDSF3-8 TaxID=3241598 RepID=UPI0035318920
MKKLLFTLFMCFLAIITYSQEEEGPINLPTTNLFIDLPEGYEIVTELEEAANLSPGKILFLELPPKTARSFDKIDSAQLAKGMEVLSYSEISLSGLEGKLMEYKDSLVKLIFLVKGETAAYTFFAPYKEGNLNEKREIITAFHSLYRNANVTPDIYSDIFFSLDEASAGFRLYSKYRDIYYFYLPGDVTDADEPAITATVMLITGDMYISHGGPSNHMKGFIERLLYDPASANIVIDGQPGLEAIHATDSGDKSSYYLGVKVKEGYLLAVGSAPSEAFNAAVFRELFSTLKFK